jgi:hypothetical protein
MAVLGVLIGLSRVSLGLGQAIFYGILGLLSLVSGIVVFFLFLRQPAGTE